MKLEDQKYIYAEVMNNVSMPLSNPYCKKRRTEDDSKRITSSQYKIRRSQGFNVKVLKKNLIKFQKL